MQEEILQASSENTRENSLHKLFIMVVILTVLLFPIIAAADGNVPEAANKIGKQLDAQLMSRFCPGGGSSNRANARSQILIMGTTPANLGNLEQANGLARQMTEEISRWLMDKGYRYEDLRKGQYIRFNERVGEFILTRNVSELASKSGVGQAILAGTYVMSGDDVRFNISLISVQNNEVLAKANGTVPITPDLRPLLIENYPAGSGLKPSVYTHLR